MAPGVHGAAKPRGGVQREQQHRQRSAPSMEAHEEGGGVQPWARGCGHGTRPGWLGASLVEHPPAPAPQRDEPGLGAQARGRTVRRLARAVA